MWTARVAETCAAIKPDVWYYTLEKEQSGAVVLEVNGYKYYKTERSAERAANRIKKKLEGAGI